MISVLFCRIIWYNDRWGHITSALLRLLTDIYHCVRDIRLYEAKSYLLRLVITLTSHKCHSVSNECQLCGFIVFVFCGFFSDIQQWKDQSSARHWPTGGVSLSQRVSNAETVSMLWRHHVQSAPNMLHIQISWEITPDMEVSKQRSMLEKLKCIDMLPFHWRSSDRLIFNMGIQIPGKDILYIETGSRAVGQFWMHISCNTTVWLIEG